MQRSLEKERPSLSLNFQIVSCCWFYKVCVSTALDHGARLVLKILEPSRLVILIQLRSDLPALRRSRLAVQRNCGASRMHGNGTAIV